MKMKSIFSVLAFGCLTLDMLQAAAVGPTYKFAVWLEGAADAAGNGIPTSLQRAFGPGSVTLVSTAQLETPGFLNAFDTVVVSRHGSSFGSFLSATAVANVVAYVGTGQGQGGVATFTNDAADNLYGASNGDPYDANLDRLFINAANFAAATHHGYIGEFNGAIQPMTTNENGATPMALLPGNASTIHGASTPNGHFIYDVGPVGSTNPIDEGVTFPFTDADTSIFRTDITGAVDGNIVDVYDDNKLPAVLANSVVISGGGGDVIYEPGPVSKYYITAGQQGMTSVAQGDSIIASWVQHFSQSPGQYAISVLDKVRIMGSFFEGVTRIGSEYTLAGVYTGKDFPFAIPGAGFWDGATDGASNYSVDYDYGGVYKFNLNWGEPALLFDTPIHYLGITFDVATSTLWLAQWENGVVEHRSLDGTILTSFEVPFKHISSLAIDPADGSLWMGSQNTLGTFYHYSPKGKQINTRVYDSLKNQNTLGGEFPLPSASQSPPPPPSPKPTVTISASPTQVQERNNATFTITRSAPSPKSLLVMYFMGGSATMGSDYTLSGKPGKATIPAGATSTTVTLHALADGGPRPESAIMTILPAPSYTVGGAKKATVNIVKATSPPPAR